MSVLDVLILRVKRGDAPATRAARDAYRWMVSWNMPRSRALDAAYAALYRATDAYQEVRELALGKLLYEPMVRARVDRVGARLQLTALPYIRGHTRISIGDDCRFGLLSVRSGRFVDRPELVIGDRVCMASGVVLVVNKRISIGDGVGIAGRCWISDSDGHPVDPDRRLRGEHLTADDIDPLTIEDHVWIGHGAKVLKGASLGRGCVVAAGSVVTSDVPAGALAMGVPARILKRPW